MHEKKTIEEARYGLKSGDVFYYADEFNLSWFPTLRAMWSPVGHQVMIPTPAQPTRHYGIGAVKYHTAETVVLWRRQKWWRELAERLQELANGERTEMTAAHWNKICIQNQ